MNVNLGLSSVKALALFLCCAILGGVAGVIAVIMCYLVVRIGGVEASDKHGIASASAVRIGGFLVLVYLLLNLAFQQLSLGAPVLSGDEAMLLVASLPFFCVGFYEDLVGNLSARLRLLIMIALAFVVVLVLPDFALSVVGIPAVDWILVSSPLIALLLSALCLAFLPNAFNAADGANGLLAGLVMVGALLLAGSTDPVHARFLQSLAVGCGLFLVYNLATGRFFLGDGGAYFLGALVGLSLIKLVKSPNISVWYLVSFIIYPVVDLLFAAIRRVFVGKSPFSADNRHLHNVLFATIKKVVNHDVAANTATGLTVVVIFSGAVVGAKLCLGWQANDHRWLLLCVLLAILYGVLWAAMSSLFSKSNS